jgi:RNAse (barnase) inhibitor barstar
MELDRQLLQNGPVVLYCGRAFLAEDIGSLRALSYEVTDLDASTWPDQHAMHRAFASALEFPEHYGKNLDALNDCIGDLQKPRYVIVLRHFDAFTKNHRAVAEAVLDILATNSRTLLLDGARLLVLVQSDDPRIAFEPLGATSAHWNPKERLDAKRGV